MGFFEKFAARQPYLPLEAGTESLLEDGSEDARPRRHQKAAARRLPASYLFHGLLVLFYTSVFLVAVYTVPNWPTRADGQGELHAHVFDGFLLSEINEYFGSPSEKLEKNWEDLLQYETLQVPKEALTSEQLVNAVELPGGGYFASTWTHHNLRCLRSLHRSLFSNHYSQNATEEHKHVSLLHATHCLDALRQSIQCTGDLSLLSMQWTDRNEKPTVNPVSYSAHQCVNWDSLRSWTKEHAYDVLAPGALVHPIFGPSYPDGELGIGLSLLSPESAES